MDISRPRVRIRHNKLKMKQLSGYYEKREAELEDRYRRITFGIALLPLVALALFQSEWPHADWIAPVLLSIAGFAEFALIHFGWGAHAKAAKIIGNQTAKLANAWDWLSSYERELRGQERELRGDKRRDINLWMEMLERQGKEIIMEPIPDNQDLRDRVFKEVIDKFEQE